MRFKFRTSSVACLVGMLLKGTAEPEAHGQSQYFSLGASLQLGAPAAGGDYDNDGDLDVLEPGLVIRNNGGLSFGYWRHYWEQAGVGRF